MNKSKKNRQIVIGLTGALMGALRVNRLPSQTVTRILVTGAVVALAQERGLIRDGEMDALSTEINEALREYWRETGHLAEEPAKPNVTGAR